MRIWFRNRSLRTFVAWSTCLTLALPSSVIAGDGPFRLGGFGSQPTAVEQLAERIDHMERSLEEYGSVVIKTPDVWGESRLMRHRSDVENQLRARLDGFQFRINAVQATRDAAFLATAIALQEQIAPAVTATTTTPGRPGDVGPLTGSAATGATSVNSATIGMIGDPNAASTNFVPRSEFQGAFKNATGLQNTTLSVGIEPVIELDQVNRYLQHLNELRRLNEGDDNADTPGYALNLIRIPVSVLPGRKTEEGFGAEVQITIDPYISDEILPLAFKDFVINGVVDRISFDVFQMAQRSNITILANDVHSANEPSTQVDIAVGPQAKFEEKLKTAGTPQLRSFVEELAAPDADFATSAINAGLYQNTTEYQKDVGELSSEQETTLGEVANQQLLYVLRADVNHFSVSIPASQREAVNLDSIRPLALHAYDCLVHTGISEFTPTRGKQVPQDHRVEHGLAMPEIETLLRKEAAAAYEFLSQPSAQYLWTQFCTPELAKNIREAQEDVISGDAADIKQLGFFEQLRSTHPKAYSSVTAAMAWQIMVESALQNEQLVRDMKETATLKNCPCISQDWMPFFGPDPVSEARYAFKEYVKCKWPIHVFALDPVTQDQNIADSFSQRREMQMSLAIAAANRGLGGQALSRFVRRMEYDLETIELNRTAVAFSHGDNTFGWRFYPRVQSPPVPSNLRATVGDLLIGGQNRDTLVRTRKLEPGIRECTALVVMPSFVPQVTVDVRTSFFRLAKHTPIHEFMHRKPGYESSMELSRELTELRRLQQKCVNDAHLYRDGEVFRLCKAVERLDDRLPLQTHNVTVPWENDLGGFEVFQSGTQVLEPELHGWYGAPGVVVADEGRRRNVLADLMRYRRLASEAQLAYSLLGTPDDTKEPWKSAKATLTAAVTNLNTAEAAYASVVAATTDTAIFLVGKNFSVLNCRVIAGGVDITGTVEVINRNLMQVRIPSTVSTVTTEHEPDNRDVVVHLATPHGATSRLLIPVAKGAKADEVADAVKKAEASAKTAADSATKVTDRHPVTLEWDVAKKDVKASWSGAGNATLSDATDNLPLKVADKRATFDFDNERSSSLQGGELLLWITCGDVKQGVNLGLMDGNCPMYANGAIDRCLTMEDLLGIVMGRIGDRLPPKSAKPATVTVRGGMKFNNGQPVIGFDDKIIFNLIPDASQAQP